MQSKRERGRKRKERTVRRGCLAFSAHDWRKTTRESKKVAATITVKMKHKTGQIVAGKRRRGRGSITASRLLLTPGYAAMGIPLPMRRKSLRLRSM
ncbi:hypothetical protein ALC53_07667 [Atta colombica]|uniref:Uncharacterized protein n=1 Tax=Atta colombica TaxID=520822 RepID=A0A195BCF3_9HYME|nr:hypothetical protein ALC53_07667 [Atta colombica]